MSIVRLENIEISREDYKGRPSSLCKGCGHNSISNQIISVAYEMSLNPHYLIKLSGIGCSSKSPAYFMSRSHGFNALHGRMPSVATGALVANHDLMAIGVSGDGDTGSIGMGQFKHLIRRNVPLVYIIENNGVYGLTKGQFSVTADEGQYLKYAGKNEFKPIDFCIEALTTGATFVARSFAGDAKQVRELMKAALAHNGTAILDIISPCVTFNNAETATKSYPYGKDHQEILQEITYVPEYEEIVLDDHQPGEERVVELHNGSHIRLKKVDPAAHDPTDRRAAINLLEDAYAEDKFLTGLFYVESDRANFTDTNHMVETPLVHLTNDQVRPSKAALDKVMDGLLN